MDWFGYPMTASPRAFDAFEKEYGYRLKTEDIVAQGMYQNNFVNPTKKFRDYMEFTEKYVTKTVQELVDIVHAEGKEAMMFLGDSWIGTEPYGEYFKEMNLDAVVGSRGGVTVRNKDIDVILYVGDEGTAFSGGEYWNDEEIVTAIRRWVAEGHGFIGVGEPTAYKKGGKFFQLSDVLGVEEEKGFTLSKDKYNIEKKAHFITEDITGEIDYGESKKNIYALSGAEV